MNVQTESSGIRIMNGNRSRRILLFFRFSYRVRCNGLVNTVRFCSGLSPGMVFGSDPVIVHFLDDEYCYSQEKPRDQQPADVVDYKRHS